VGYRAEAARRLIMRRSFWLALIPLHTSVSSDELSTVISWPAEIVLLN